MLGPDVQSLYRWRTDRTVRGTHQRCWGARPENPQYHIVMRMLGSVFLSTISPVTAVVLLMTTPGFSLSQAEIWSSMNLMAPGWSFVKNVLQVVIRPAAPGAGATGFPTGTWGA